MTKNRESPAQAGAGEADAWRWRLNGKWEYGDKRILKDEVTTHQALFTAAPNVLAMREALQALKRAAEFIRNGRALGYIRMPDADVPDSAHETPGIIDAAIALLSLLPEPQEGHEPPCDHSKHLLTGYEKGDYIAWCGACGVITHCDDFATAAYKDRRDFSGWIERNIAAFGCAAEANSGKGGVYGKEKKGPCKVWCGSTGCPMTLKRAHGIGSQDATQK